MQESGQINHKVAGQRFGLIVLAGSLLYSLFAGMSPGGTFSETSKSSKASVPAAYDGEDQGEESGWGSATRGARSRDPRSEARARAQAQRAAHLNGSDRPDTPVYDPGKDGGWGSP